MKSSLKLLGFAFLAFVISGCTARAYTQVRERVDQGTTGNAGYIYGTPPPVDQSKIRKTRKTYVLEFATKSKEPAAAPVTRKRGSIEVSEESSRESMPPTPIIPPIPDINEPAGVDIEYTVEKGDTLQKISKKFYDTYRKWNTIYEANKDRIGDPNRIKPGTVLLIPDASSGSATVEQNLK